MNETFVTVVGNVAAEPKMRVTSGGARVTSFRMAVNERKFNKSLDRWRDGDTIWLTVTSWRALAENVFESVLKGQQVVVHGRLRVNSYDDKEGQQRTTVEIDATAVGHDLSRGTTQLTKMSFGPSAERQIANELAAESADELAAQLAAEFGEQVGGRGGEAVAGRPLATVGDTDGREHAASDGPDGYGGGWDDAGPGDPDLRDGSAA